MTFRHLLGRALAAGNTNRAVQSVSSSRRLRTMATASSKPKARPAATAAAATASSKSAPRPTVTTTNLPLPFCDIGLNLLADQYQGRYHSSKPKHAADVNAVLYRSAAVGCRHLVITAGSVEESREALALAKQYPNVYCTAGIHPTRASTVFKSRRSMSADAAVKAALQELEAVVLEGLACGKLVSMGEMGLDYDRLQFSSREEQLLVFQPQIRLAAKHQLPLFLHDRNTGNDFIEQLRICQSELASVAQSRSAKHGKHMYAGVVHSFTGTVDEVQALLQFNALDAAAGSNQSSDDASAGLLLIGINGCSMKTEANLATLRTIPLQRLLLETDGPYCDIKPTHASYQYVQSHFNTVGRPEKYEPMEVSKEQVDASLLAPLQPSSSVDNSQFQLVKARCEPCQIVQVAEAVAAVRETSVAELAHQVMSNTQQWIVMSDS